MKILKPGNRSSNDQIVKQTEKIVCPICEAELEVCSDDWRIDYGTGNKYIDCPCCSFSIKKEETDTSAEILIKDIVKNLDVERIHKTMEALNWHWAGIEGIPTEDNIKDFVFDLMHQSLKRKSCISCGGFNVRYLPEDENGGIGFEVAFEVENWCEFYDTDGKIQFA